MSVYCGAPACTHFIGHCETAPRGGGSIYGRIVGTFFQPVRRMAMMIDTWMYTSNIGAIFSVTILPSKD